MYVYSFSSQADELVRIAVLTSIGKELLQLNEEYNKIEIMLIIP